MVPVGKGPIDLPFGIADDDELRAIRQALRHVLDQRGRRVLRLVQHHKRIHQREAAQPIGGHELELPVVLQPPPCPRATELVQLIQRRLAQEFVTQVLPALADRWVGQQ